MTQQKDKTAGSDSRESVAEIEKQLSSLTSMNLASDLVQHLKVNMDALLATSATWNSTMGPSSKRTSKDPGTSNKP